VPRIAGTAKDVVDRLESWFRKHAADGFMISPAYLPAGFDEFVENVVPERQRHELFRREYAGVSPQLHRPRPEPAREPVRPGARRARGSGGAAGRISIGETGICSGSIDGLMSGRRACSGARQPRGSSEMNVDNLRAWLEGLNEATFPEVPLAESGDGTFAGRFRRRELSSVFQPVLSTVDGATVAHSARVRSLVAGQDELPANVFALTGPDALVVQLDRSARTLHALNYYPRAQATWRLFLRVQARLVESVGSGHGRVFEGILGRLGVPTRNVVIELPRHANEDPALYARALMSYRSLGYRVASECLDLHDALLAGRYEAIPDIVAIDPRGLPAPGALGRLIEQIRDRGTTVLVHRIESAADAAEAIEAGADLLQGFYLGHPARRPEAPALDAALLARRSAQREPVA